MTTSSRIRLSWWDAAYAAGLAALAVVTLVADNEVTARVVGGLISLGVLAIGYVLIGRRPLVTGSNPWPFATFLVVATGAAVFFVPYLASLQALVIPSLWFLIDGPLRRPIAATLAVGVSVTAGTVLGSDPSWPLLGEVVTYEALSMVFSIAFGIWITRIGERGDEKARLLEELQGTQGALELAHRETGAAAERERLAREIHDTIAQSLTSLVLLAQRTRGELTGATRVDGSAEGRTSSASITHALDTVDLIESTAREALGEARSLVVTLAPVPFGDGGLGPVLARLAERFERETGVVVTSSAAGGAGIARDVEVVLLRCAQEGLANVRKHADARHAWISVTASERVVTLLVDDDGAGPRGYSAARETGFGLTGMRDRLDLVGGSVELMDRPGGGARLLVTVAAADGSGRIEA